MKIKKIAAIICTLALAMALPLGMAFADNPSQETAEVEASGANGTTLTVTGTFAQLHAEGVLGECDLHVEATDTWASNTPTGAKVIASYYVYYDALSEHSFGHGWIHTGGTLSFALGTGGQYANYYYTCYIEHEDGETEVFNGTTDSNGVATFSVSRLSYYTFVIGDKVQTSTDNSSTSPQTGLDLTVAGGIAVIAIAVAGVAVVARRKMSE